MICHVLAVGKQHLGPHVIVGYGSKNFSPGLFIMSPDHLVKANFTNLKYLNLLLISKIHCTVVVMESTQYKLCVKTLANRVPDRLKFSTTYL